MFNRLGLFAARSGSHLLARKVQRRNIWNFHVYPYPAYYVGQIEWPSQAHYRETYEDDWWCEREHKIAEGYMIIFWAWFFFQLFDDPGAAIGHFHSPNPRKWTDEELGIPPLEAGPYKEWLRKKSEEQNSN